MNIIHIPAHLTLPDGYEFKGFTGMTPELAEAEFHAAYPEEDKECAFWHATTRTLYVVMDVVRQEPEPIVHRNE